MNYKQITAALIIIFSSINFTFSQIGNQNGDSKSNHDSIKITANFPKAIGNVNDFENIIDSETIALLNDMIIDHQKKTSDQIAIVTMRNIFPYNDMHQYANDLGNYWGVGIKSKNNGVTIVLSKNKRDVAIAVGLGLETKLTDKMCKTIIDEIMIPQFKQSDYNKGLIEGLKYIIKVLEEK